MDPVTAQFIGMLGSGLTQFLGGNNALNQQQWNQHALVDMLNWLRASQGMYGGMMNNIADPLRNAAIGATDMGQQFLMDPQYGMFPRMGEAGWQQMQDANRDYWDPNRGLWQDPVMQERMRNLQSIGGLANLPNDVAMQMLSGGGPREGVAGANNLAQLFAQGQMNPQQALLSPGYEALDFRGQTNLNTFLGDRAFDTFAQGGYTPGLGNLAGYSQGFLSSGGQTPTGATAQGVGLETLLGGGASAGSDWLQQRGAQLAGQDALLPMDQVVNIARDQAGTRGAQMYESLMRQALARGGGPGNIMGAGSQQGVMGEFSDDLLRQEAAAVQNAILQQQGLQLQQQGQGFGALGQGLGAAAQREGIASGLVSDLERNATANLGLGISGLGQAEQTALSRLLGMGGLGLQGSQDQLSRMNFGANAMNSVLGSQQQGLAQLLQGLGLDANMIGQASNQLFQGADLWRGLENDIWNVYNQQQGQNLARLGGQYGSWQNAFSGMNQLGNNALNYWSQGMNTGGQLSGQYGQLAGQALGGMNVGAPSTGAQNFFKHMGGGGG